MLRNGLLGGAVAWAAIIPLAAFAASRPHAASFAYAFALGVYGIGHIICHQIPARSFHLWGAALPVCARCTGIYAGAALASIVVWTRRRVTATHVAGTDTAAPARRLLLAALAPTLVTLVYEWTTGITPAHWIRALTGVPLGAAVAWLIGTANWER
jgi:uncharacterized membrane protein